MAESETDEFAPVLSGPGESDYERYLRTEELLSLQKGPDEWAHRDELLFTVVHQSSELWLKLAAAELEEAIACLRDGRIAPALRVLRRVVLAIRYTTDQLDMLEQMSPWDYQAVRTALGHGSGFDSPGVRAVRHLAPALGEVFHKLRRAAGLSLPDLFVHDREHEDLYQLAEALIEVDERLILWRMRHFKVVERSIGGEVVGTQGTPVELLGRLIHTSYYPELWKVRTELTNLSLAQAQEAAD